MAVVTAETPSAKLEKKVSFKGKLKTVRKEKSEKKEMKPKAVEKPERKISKNRMDEHSSVKETKKKPSLEKVPELKVEEKKVIKADVESGEKVNVKEEMTLLHGDFVKFMRKVKFCWTTLMFAVLVVRVLISATGCLLVYDLACL